jgi:hypothetical protein
MRLLLKCQYWRLGAASCVKQNSNEVVNPHSHGATHDSSGFETGMPPSLIEFPDEVCARQRHVGSLYQTNNQHLTANLSRLHLSPPRSSPLARRQHLHHTALELEIASWFLYASPRHADNFLASADDNKSGASAGCHLF